MNIASLSPLEVIGAADEVLTAAGYRRVEPAWGHSPSPEGTSSRTYEDEFGVVGLYVFETPDSLDAEWVDAQSELVNTMTTYIGREEDKAWDGYLVLLTPVASDSYQSPRLNQIRYDTSRARKIVASGEELQSISDVTRVLLPLLPLGPASRADLPTSALDLLPDLLVKHEIDPGLTARLVDAYQAQEPMIRVIYDSLSGE